MSYDVAKELHPSTLRTIGQGFCGTIWASENGGPALKREDGGPHRSLRNDFEMHRRILECSQRLPGVQVQIPACDHFIAAENHVWWHENQQKFPPSHRTPCNLIQSQRIPPFPEATRRLLIHNFCPPCLAPEISTSAPNKDCLIRPYLGRRRTPRPHNMSRFTPFSLRNFPLHVDQMEALEIPSTDIEQYAKIMAEALAMMHWVAEIDGNDIEFVLAPPPAESPSDSTSEDMGIPYTRGLEIESRALQTHSMWILDFDLCRHMDMNSNGVEQATIAFWRNDPYYPQPGKGLDTDRSLWALFREHYIERSGAYIDFIVDEPEEAKTRRGLSKQFIELIEQEGSARKANSKFTNLA